MAEKILILTPVKDAETSLETYFKSINQLTYPHQLISLAFLESDSVDRTYEEINKRLPELNEEFESAYLWKKDYGFRIPEGMPRWALKIQVDRRSILAKSRNQLLFHALKEQDWVLWIDVDVIEYPPDIIETFLATGKSIIHPHCVKKYGGKSFDLNAWRNKGKKYMHDLRSEGDLVKIHGVGGTMLFIKADIHREGLVFPPFLYGTESKLIRHNNYFSGTKGLEWLLSKKYKGEIETEGLGIMAYDMGYECWGMPNLEIIHKDA